MLWSLVQLNGNAGEPCADPAGPIFWWSFLAAGVGVLSGFQGVYERYPNESPLLAVRPWGILYLLSRGALPAVIFLTIPASQAERFHPAVLALGLGVSAELVLRLVLFIKQSKAEGGTSTDVLVGPFDLLRWYQDLFLDRLGILVGEWRQDSVHNAIPLGMDFDSLCQQVENQLLLIQRDAAHEELKRVVRSVRDEFDRAQDAPDKEQRFKERLGFRIRNVVGERELRMLFRCP